MKWAARGGILCLALTGCGRQFPAPVESPKVPPTIPPATFIRVAVWSRPDWNPTCVLFTRDGLLLVAEDSARVQNYSALGNRGQAQPISVWSFSGLTRPVQIAQGASHIFIADMGDGTPNLPIRVLEYNPVGDPPYAPINSIRDTNWVAIRGLAADLGQNLFVSCDARVNVINQGAAPTSEIQSAIYRYHGGVRDTLAEQGTGVGTVSGPGSIFWEDGFLYVADTDKDWAQKLDASQKNLGLFKVDGTESDSLSPAGLKAPLGVSADGQGYLYIADTGRGRVLRYTTSGSYDQVVNQSEFLSPGASGNLISPSTVSSGVLSSTSKLYCYVGDPKAHQINVYRFQR